MMDDSEKGLVLVAIVMLLLCGMGFCTICLESNDEDDNDRPRQSFQQLLRILKSSGNNPSGLQSIPVVHFNSSGSKDSVECVVCLSNLADGDKAKVLPSCNHWFHVECIDTWFQSHSTCPICRTMVELTPNHNSVVQSYSGQVVIDIPAEPRI